MRMYDLIIKKRNKGRLEKNEIDFIVQKYTAGEIPDYQVSALLMAIWFNEMDDDERANLTFAMMSSGKILDLSDIAGIKVDKHSTGGVGDKVSIPLAPIVASCGVPVPMMSGRGLGHTGGTLDKLEAIKGLRTDLTEKEFRKALEQVGAAIIGQTSEVAPADKKMYALRDVTATVDSLSLIVASIMSKKLAEGVDALVFDVKTGAGAFMKTYEDAKQMAQSLVGVGKQMGKKVKAVISDMNQPLGTKVGNGLEIEESIDILKGMGPSDTTEVVKELSKSMLILGDVAATPEEAMKMVEHSISSGRAFNKFIEMVKFQGGDIGMIEEPARLPGHKGSLEITAPKSGYVRFLNAERVGISGMVLGAGRENKDSVIDHGVGVVLHKKVGDKVEQGELIAELKYNDEKRLDEAADILKSAYAFSEEEVAKFPLIYEVIE